MGGREEAKEGGERERERRRERGVEREKDEHKSLFLPFPQGQHN